MIILTSEQVVRDAPWVAEGLIECWKKSPDGLPHLTFDAEGVKALDWMINDSHRTDKSPPFVPKETRQNSIFTYGCFLGECIRRTYGGRWAVRNGVAAVEVNADLIAYPFNKVAKQFKNGDGDSVFGYYIFIKFGKGEGLKANLW